MDDVDRTITRTRIVVAFMALLLAVAFVASFSPESAIPEERSNWRGPPWLWVVVMGLLSVEGWRRWPHRWVRIGLVVLALAFTIGVAVGLAEPRSPVPAG